jgi:xanthine dehydrogenase accessory factor
VQAPAGLDLGKVDPAEIGVAVLAELVALKGSGGLKAAVPAPTSGQEARDPVCGMTVDVTRARHRSEHDGRTFFFCSAGCRREFEADPAKYGAA